MSRLEDAKVAFLVGVAAFGLGCDDEAPLNSRQVARQNISRLSLSSLPADTLEQDWSRATFEFRLSGGDPDGQHVGFIVEPFRNEPFEVPEADIHYLNQASRTIEVNLPSRPPEENLLVSVFAVDDNGDSATLADSAGQEVSSVGHPLRLNYSPVALPGALATSNMQGRARLAIYGQEREVVTQSSNGGALTGASVSYRIGQPVSSGDTLWILLAPSRYSRELFFPRAMRLTQAECLEGSEIHLQADPADGSAFRFYPVPETPAPSAPAYASQYTLAQLLDRLHYLRSPETSNWLEFVGVDGTGFAVSIPNFAAAMQHIESLKQALLERLGGGDPEAIYFWQRPVPIAGENEPWVLAHQVGLATLKGTLRDSSGNPAAYAAVLVDSADVSDITNQYGEFTIRRVPPGIHNLTVRSGPTSYPFLGVEIPLSATPPYQCAEVELRLPSSG